MYVVTEADAAAIKEAYETRGELSAAVELLRRFPGVPTSWRCRATGARGQGGIRWQPLIESGTAGCTAFQACCARCQRAARGVDPSVRCPGYPGSSSGMSRPSWGCRLTRDKQPATIHTLYTPTYENYVVP